MWVDEALAQARASFLTRTEATLQGLPSGPAATIVTLREMRRLARESVRAANQAVREQALSLVADLPERRWAQEIARLHAFVRDRIRYVRDPAGIELVATPEKTLEYGQGDCDDKCTLLAALLESLCHPAKFVALGFANQPFSHVIVETRLGPRWLPLETIHVGGEPKPAGWSPPHPTSRYELKV